MVLSSWTASFTRFRWALTKNRLRPKTLARRSKRLASRLEGRRSWGAQQIDRCIRAFDTDITEIKLATDSLTVGQAAERAAEIAGVPLIPDRRGPLRRSLHRLATQCRHIRLP